ncbi:hypothetical protein L6252_01745 [Candidatus Parcubacteria bacterium]|nr:hypothetical protein [Candidatus Parcubacteria bacterium]
MRDNPYRYLSKLGFNYETTDMVLGIISEWEKNKASFWPIGDINKKERNRLEVILSGAISELNPIYFFVPVCPDYPINPQSEELGMGIGQTANTLLPLIEILIKPLRKLSVPFCCSIILADTETDLGEVVSLLTNGSQQEFLTRCQKSLEVIRGVAPKEAGAYTFSEFFKGTWHTMQYFWEDVVKEKSEMDRGINSWIEQWAIRRTDKYQQQFGRCLRTNEKIKVAIRHYAQYLTLGYFLRQYPGAVLVNTDSPNLKAIRNPFLIENPPIFLPSIENQQQKVPIIVPLC